MSLSMTAPLKGVPLAAALLASIGLAGLSPAHAQFGSNLIVNGNAEAGIGSSDGSVVAVPNFTTTGNFTVVQYAAGNGFPAPTDPGPVARGLNFFAGGPTNASSSASQLINLLPESSVINAGGASFTLSAFLGGYSGQGDNAVLSVSFLGMGGATLGTVALGPVTPADRGSATGLLFRTTNGFVPVGAQSANVNLQMTRIDGDYNDGYADNLSLVLGQPAPVPEASGAASLGLLLTFGAGGLFLAARRKRAIPGV